MGQGKRRFAAEAECLTTYSSIDGLRQILFPCPCHEVISFALESQSRSNIPPCNRPRRKENEEPRANTYVATSMRSKHATDDEPEETELVEVELAHATIRR